VSYCKKRAVTLSLSLSVQQEEDDAKADTKDDAADDDDTADNNKANTTPSSSLDLPSVPSRKLGAHKHPDLPDPPNNAIEPKPKKSKPNPNTTYPSYPSIPTKLPSKPSAYPSFNPSYNPPAAQQPAVAKGSLVIKPKLGIDLLGATVKAEKFIKHANSALRFQDVNGAVTKLVEAIAVLLPHSSKYK